MEKRFDFVLVGGGVASASAAETLRAEGTQGRILVIAGEDRLPYGHSSLSKQFLLSAQSADALKLHSEGYYRDLAIDLMLGVHAVDVDTTNRPARVRSCSVIWL